MGHARPHQAVSGPSETHPRIKKGMAVYSCTDGVTRIPALFLLMNDVKPFSLQLRKQGWALQQPQRDISVLQPALLHTKGG